jgi:hypothetical protein
MQKQNEVLCECGGTGVVAVVDAGGDGIDYVECGAHHPAYRPEQTINGRMEHILAQTEELKRLVDSNPSDLLVPKNPIVRSDDNDE